jgi:hypothetical protein
MSEHDAPIPPADLSERVAALEAELQSVRAGLADLAADLAREVRSARLVVVDPDGFERVVADADASHGALTVRARTGAQRSTAVELYADDPVDADAARAGVALGHQGDIVAVIEVGGERPARWWFLDAGTG